MTFNDGYTASAPEYFAPLPDLGLALERIGLDPAGDYSPSLENLQRLMLAHIMTVPYETLDCCDYMRRVDFAPEHLFEKFVLNRRGSRAAGIRRMLLCYMKITLSRILSKRRVLSMLGQVDSDM